MSELILNEKTEKGFQDGFLNGCTFLYMKIQRGDEKYQSKELEYSVQLGIDEDTCDAFAEEFPKNTFRSIKTGEFEAKFGCAPPYPDEKKQYMVQLKTPVKDYQGNEVEYHAYKRPKVFVPLDTGEVEDITLTQLIANGSTGDVRFWVSENDFGRFPRLQGVLVTNLIPYESAGGGGGDTAWGNVKKKPNAFKATPSDVEPKEKPPEDEEVDIPF